MNKAKILIIDDEEAVLKMYKAKLDSEGYETFTATSGKDGIESIKNKKPDLVFLDIIMPRYNGLDILKDIRADKNIAGVPVYLLTNLPEESSEEKAKQLGATGYLVKAQYEPEKLVQTVKKELKKIIR